MHTHPKSRAILKAAQVQLSVPTSILHPLNFRRVKENHFQTVMNSLYSHLFAYCLPLRKCKCSCWLWKRGGHASVLPRCEERTCSCLDALRYDSGGGRIHPELPEHTPACDCDTCGSPSPV